MFAGKAGAYPSEAPFINIRLGWKGFLETNTLPYYENLLITAVKGYIVQAPGHNVIKKFTTIIYLVLY